MQKRIHKKIRPDNTTGITGIAVSYTRSRNKERTKLWYYAVRVGVDPETGKDKKEYFSWSKWGKDNAWAMAKACRLNYLSNINKRR